jgi:hypothetical protein
MYMVILFPILGVLATKEQNFAIYGDSLNGITVREIIHIFRLLKLFSHDNWRRVRLVS